MIMDEKNSIECLCKRLAGLDEVFLPIKKVGTTPEVIEDKGILTAEKKYDELQKHFEQSPMRFLQRYYEHIKPNEISCFNSLPENEQVCYYIRQICHKQDLKARTELDSHYISHEVKNRRYQAMQQMIKEGEYFNEEEMSKRNPKLYQHYIGRFLSAEEKEERMSARAAAHPTTLSGFFMDVIEKKWDKEDENQDEEFDDDSEEEEERVPDISEEEKEFLAEEFKSRMYESFLSGMDKNFSYEDVDMNTDYDDFHQIERDVEDDYFDQEEPSLNLPGEVDQGAEDSEDELDRYMKTIDSSGNG
ncbi:coiled-coil domain-containing protein 97-like [Styela clava]